MTRKLYLLCSYSSLAWDEEKSTKYLWSTFPLSVFTIGLWIFFVNSYHTLFFSKPRPLKNVFTCGHFFNSVS